MTPDTWHLTPGCLHLHLTPDTWHLGVYTCTWHLTPDTWVSTPASDTCTWHLDVNTWYPDTWHLYLTPDTCTWKEGSSTVMAAPSPCRFPCSTACDRLSWKMSALSGIFLDFPMPSLPLRKTYSLSQHFLYMRKNFATAAEDHFPDNARKSMLSPKYKKIHNSANTAPKKFKKKFWNPWNQGIQNMYTV